MGRPWHGSQTASPPVDQQHIPGTLCLNSQFALLIAGNVTPAINRFMPRVNDTRETVVAFAANTPLVAMTNYMLVFSGHTSSRLS
jgi:hypothetical protein